MDAVQRGRVLNGQGSRGARIHQAVLTTPLARGGERAQFGCPLHAQSGRPASCALRPSGGRVLRAGLRAKAKHCLDTVEQLLLPAVLAVCHDVVVAKPAGRAAPGRQLPHAVDRPHCRRSPDLPPPPPPFACCSPSTLIPSPSFINVTPVSSQRKSNARPWHNERVSKQLAVLQHRVGVYPCSVCGAS